MVNGTILSIPANFLPFQNIRLIYKSRVYATYFSLSILRHAEVCRSQAWWYHQVSSLKRNAGRQKWRNRYSAEKGHSIKILSFTSFFASCLFNRIKISIENYWEREGERERHRYIFEYRYTVRCTYNPVTSIYRGWRALGARGWGGGKGRNLWFVENHFCEPFSFCSPPHLHVDISLPTFASFYNLPSKLGFGSPFHDRSQKFATAHCDGNWRREEWETASFDRHSGETILSVDRTLGDGESVRKEIKKKKKKSETVN